ncbi:peptidase M12A astacin [Oceanithermus profundus DSM 14977]|uniref:Peptidase M12A astacin n=1 Tax=Oceanithermus profundus (strain DSM 14977 / NBRC 100410 / VKM B-2274 / 506) TaxID=670487 RepID=E4U484_OCEP5|nr:M12 family metallopeptidase [Oceanithermus profundus]ADR36169.1 peptidase M12A astacin [Oceanithermus profundus DSM 14977]
MTRTRWLFLLALLAAGCSAPQPGSGGGPEPNVTEQYKPNVPGEVRTFTLPDGSRFTATVKDGLVIWQGDMILGPLDAFEASLARGASPLANSCDYRDDECDRWPGRIVYYEITSSSTSFRDKVLRALDHIEAKTNLSFRERDSGERIVYNRVEGSCSAEIGNNQAWYSAVPDVDCDDRGFGWGSFVHETLHALGFAHEQGRDDRNDFVRINWDRIEDDKKHNFEKSDGANFWIFNFFPIGPYDYDSIMHYPCRAFAKPGAGRTIEPLDPAVGCDRLGQRSGLSDGDVLGILTIYRPELSITAPTTPVPRDQRLYVSAFGRDDQETRAVLPYLTFTLDGTPMDRDPASTTATSSLLGLTAGPHTVTASVVISGEVVTASSTTVTLSNVPPTVAITQPVSTGPYCRNETVTLRALASDADTAPYFESGNVNDRIDWIYDPDPTDILAGIQFAPNTATATYTLTDTGTVRFIARVDDADGTQATDSIDLTVEACTNTPPQVAITSPSGDLNVWTNGSDENGRYYQIALAGTASDAEDGPLTGQWYTNRGDVQPGAPASGDQLLGAGNNLTVKLYAEGGKAVTTHVISFVVTDSDGNTRIATVQITVNQLI